VQGSRNRGRRRRAREQQARQRHNADAGVMRERSTAAGE
jgi:hypothetical protein